ncbi:MAG: hypothetical protein FWC70_07780 [Defluviitaleaceae bacterium]|nr:hypothetical protein [Defluviitaleaceae bacterium]
MYDLRHIPSKPKAASLQSFRGASYSALATQLAAHSLEAGSCFAPSPPAFYKSAAKQKIARMRDFFDCILWLIMADSAVARDFPPRFHGSPGHSRYLNDPAGFCGGIYAKGD